MSRLKLLIKFTVIQKKTLDILQFVKIIILVNLIIQKLKFCAWEDLEEL